MGKFIDFTGQRFGRLTVIERDGSRGKNATWLCQCICGKQTVVSSYDLKRGNTSSCGCIQREKAAQRVLVHGKRRTRLYAVWASIKSRCYNPASNRYGRYGGRGIKVCDEWLHDFGAFYNWAMSNGYDENAPRGKCTIDRIDNDKGYSPDNCRWVDMGTQSNNRSNSKKK